MAQAQVQEEGVKLQDGTFVVSIEQCLGKQTNLKGYCFISEFKVITSTNPANPVGSKAGFVQDLRIPQMAWSRLMYFVAALIKKDIRDSAQLAEVRTVCEQVMNDCVAGKYNGAQLVVISQRSIAKNGHTYQKYTFQPHFG